MLLFAVLHGSNGNAESMHTHTRTQTKEEVCVRVLHPLCGGIESIKAAAAYCCCCCFLAIVVVVF